MAYLTKTTFDEIAALADEMELGDRIIFSTEDPDELAFYGIPPIKWNAICKSKLFDEKDYVIIIAEIFGRCTVAKDINILANGHVNDEDERIDGITDFLKEYYDKYMEKNKYGNVYLVVQ